MNFANTNNIPFSLFYIKIKLKFSGKRLAFKSNSLNENREKTRVQNTKPRNIYAFTLTFFTTEYVFIGIVRIRNMKKSNSFNK